MSVVFCHYAWSALDGSAESFNKRESWTVGEVIQPMRAEFDGYSEK